jgi:hypothetical protein
MTSGRDAGSGDGATTGQRASAAAVGVVFLGLAIVTALLAGSFWVVATGGGDPGEPAKVDVGTSRCTVSTVDAESGVGTAVLSVTYSGPERVDLADATVRYGDERTSATLDVARTANTSAASLENGTGAYDPSIERGETLTVTVPVELVRGEPLDAGQRATVELRVDGGPVGSASVRPPNGMSASQTYVDC